MKAIWKWAVVVGSVVVVGFGALVLSVVLYHRTGPSSQEQRARANALQPLLQSHATKERISEALGLTFEDFSKDSTNRWVLEQRISIPKVRQLAERYPKVLFHTTAYTMTWLFFDSEGRLQEYYLCEQ
jgi:hypothetical protein